MGASKVPQITDSIISSIRNSLSTLYFEPTDFLILRKIIYLSILHGYNSPKRTIYATPGARWIAQATGYHRVTVSRRITFLKEKGFLAITYRRKVKGHFQTNLYRFGKVLWALIKDVTKRFNAFFSRVTPALHIVSLNRINTSKEVNFIEHDTGLKAILTRIEEKLLLKEGSPPTENH